jgi:Dephospho-CoA kinase
MRIIGTVGLPGSGKGEAATVARREEVPVVVMGDVIRKACRDRGLDPAQHHGQVAQRLREEEGPAAVAERTLPLIRDSLANADTDTAVVDGLRSPTELKTFRSAFDDQFLVVSIEAPFELRAERLAERSRDDSDADLETLRTRDERELELGIGKVMQAADLQIDNSRSLERFRASIQRLLEKGAAAAVNGEVQASEPDSDERSKSHSANDMGGAGQ